MGTFNYEDYQNLVANAQQKKASSYADKPKIGFFKLGVGETALVRFNVASIADLTFATVHHPVYGKSYEGLWNPYGGLICSCDEKTGVNNCVLCEAVKNGHQVVGKAEKVFFLKMLVSYRDNTTFAFSDPIPVIWERKAGFSSEIAAKLKNFGGDLTKFLFTITRTGTGKETKYTVDYAIPEVYKPELIPADFSAFNEYDLKNHAYIEKSAEDINAYLTTGTFPKVEYKKNTDQTATQPTIQTDLPYPQGPFANAAVEAAEVPLYQGVAPQQPVQGYTPYEQQMSAQSQVVNNSQKQEATSRPARNFNVRY